MKGYVIYCVFVLVLIFYSSSQGSILIRWSDFFDSSGSGGGGTYYRGSGYGSGGGYHK